MKEKMEDKLCKFDTKPDECNTNKFCFCDSFKAASQTYDSIREITEYLRDSVENNNLVLKELKEAELKRLTEEIELLKQRSRETWAFVLTKEEKKHCLNKGIAEIDYAREKFRKERPVCKSVKLMDDEIESIALTDDEKIMCYESGIKEEEWLFNKKETLRDSNRSIFISMENQDVGNVYLPRVDILT